MSRTKCSFWDSGMSRLNARSCKTFPFRRFQNKLSCRFAWQAWHFVTFSRVYKKRRKSFCVAGAIFLIISFAEDELHFSWQPPSSFYMAGAALQACHVARFWLIHFPFHTLHSSLPTPHFEVHTPHFTLLTPHFTLYNPHFTLHTLHSTLYTPHSTLHTLHFTLYTSLSTLYTPRFTLYTPHTTVYTPRFTLHTLHSTLYTPHFTPYTPHFTPYTPNSILYTPDFAPFTLHFALHILHVTLYTPHFTLHNPHFTLYTLHSPLNNPLSSRSTLGTPTPSTFHCLQCTGKVTGENFVKCTRLFKNLFHKSLLRDCIQVRWFLLFFSPSPSYCHLLFCIVVCSGIVVSCHVLCMSQCVL